MPEVKKYKIGGSELSGPQGINPEWFVQRITELEEENESLKNRVSELESTQPEPKTYRAETCMADPCENCGGCEEWTRDH